MRNTWEWYLRCVSATVSYPGLRWNQPAVASWLNVTVFHVACVDWTCAGGWACVAVATRDLLEAAVLLLFTALQVLSAPIYSGVSLFLHRR